MTRDQLYKRLSGARAGVEGCGKFVPTGIRSQGRISRGACTEYAIPAVINIIIISSSSSSSSSSTSRRRSSSSTVLLLVVVVVVLVVVVVAVVVVASVQEL